MKQLTEVTVLRYTEAIQKQIGSKTKPEPWLHIVKDGGKTSGLTYAIYVWDTRKVVEQGHLQNYQYLHGLRAIDSGKQLIGLDDKFSSLNRLIESQTYDDIEKRANGIANVLARIYRKDGNYTRENCGYDNGAIGSFLNVLNNTNTSKPALSKFITDIKSKYNGFKMT